jgi:hypothetical protein
MDIDSGTKFEQPTARVARREERRETNWIALIRLPDGTEIPTTVKDISPSGARLAVPSSYALPKSFMFKVIGRDFVCAVQLAWRRGDYAGVRIERVGKIASAPAKAPGLSVELTAALRARRSRFSQV